MTRKEHKRLKEMIYEEALEIDEARIKCVENCFAGHLWVYGRLFNKATKIIKKQKKREKKNEKK